MSILEDISLSSVEAINFIQATSVIQKHFEEGGLAGVPAVVAQHNRQTNTTLGIVLENTPPFAEIFEHTTLYPFLQRC
jgi:hypothetical protein